MYLYIIYRIQWMLNDALCSRIVMTMHEAHHVYIVFMWWCGPREVTPVSHLTTQQSSPINRLSAIYLPISANWHDSVQTEDHWNKVNHWSMPHYDDHQHTVIKSTLSSQSHVTYHNKQPIYICYVAPWIKLSYHQLRINNMLFLK